MPAGIYERTAEMMKKVQLKRIATMKENGTTLGNPVIQARRQATMEKNGTTMGSPIILAKIKATKNKNGTTTKEIWEQQGKEIQARRKATRIKNRTTQKEIYQKQGEEITNKIRRSKEENGTTEGEIWKNLEYQKSQRIGRSLKPNNLEQFFDKMTPKHVKYVGDFSLWIKTEKGNRNPDFIIKGQNKAIELFGNYYHEGENPEDKIKEYSEAGWECIIFWEHEVYDNTERVLKETMEFIEEKETCDAIS